MNINTTADLAKVLDQVPYWVLEDEMKDRAQELESICDQADDLKKALDTGVNMVVLRHERNGKTEDDYECWDEHIGYKKMDNTYSLNEPYHENMLTSIGVEFVELYTDDDNMTCAIFRQVED